MNVLILNGSPRARTSNTIKIAHAFAEGLRDGVTEPESVTVDEIDVIAKKIGPCRGCFSCWTKTPGICVIKDDMEGVLERIKAADVVVWSFPLYYFGMPSHLKALTDRMLPLNLPEMGPRGDGGSTHAVRYDLSGQRQVMISTSGFPSVRNNYEALLAQFAIMFGSDGFTPIVCPEGELFAIPQLKSRCDSYLARAREAGRQFARDGRVSEATTAELSTLLFGTDSYFRMANANWEVADDIAESADAGGVGGESGDRAPASGGVASSRDEQYSFLEQMAAIYDPTPLGGERRVLEMRFTDLGTTYQLTMDGRACAVSAVPEDGPREPYTTRIETPWTVWRDISSGELDGAAALMQGKYRVVGDFAFMLIIDRVFATGPVGEERFDLREIMNGRIGAVPGGASAGDATSRDRETSGKKANMLVLLAPWIVAWIGLPLFGGIGAVGSAFAASLVALASRKWRTNPCEAVSGAAVAALSLAVLVGLPVNVAVPVSYAAFGLLWLASCLTKIPLTAYYSAEGYGGDGAMKNPLFMKTNAILTAAWGILYVLTAVWTVFLLRTPAARFVGLINNACPALMGLFTAWFQKWYPARVASRGKQI